MIERKPILNGYPKAEYCGDNFPVEKLTFTEELKFMVTICDLERELFKFIDKHKTMPTILALNIIDCLNLRTFTNSLQTGNKLYFEGVEVRMILTRDDTGFSFGFKQLELSKPCKTCGANDFIEKTDRYTCLYCGNDYDKSTNKLIETI